MLFSVLALVLRRSLGHWRLLTLVAIGVLLSAALASSTAIYADAIRDLGLSYALRQVSQLDLDVTVSSTSFTTRAQDYAARRQQTANTANSYATPYLRGSVEYGRSATFYLTAPGQPVPKDEQRPRAFFEYQDNLPDHVRIVEGDLTLHTDPVANPAQPPTVRAVVGQESAERLGIHIGDTFDLHPYWHLELAPVVVVVAGIIEQRAPTEEYWMGRTDRLSVTTTSWSTYPFFVDQQTLTNTIAVYLADMEADYTTLFTVNRGSIVADNATRANRAFNGLAGNLHQNLPRTTVSSKTADTIATYQSKLFFSRLPLFALIMQVVGIILYYVVMVSTMLVDRQAGEIALLKSRGAGTRQVLALFALEGGLIALIGALVAPYLAAAVVRLLGPTPPFHDLSGGGLLRTHVSVQARELAALGALLSFAALLWPAYRASRLSIVLYKQAVSRPQRTPAFFRYYLDVFLIVAAGVLFYELRQRGSLVTQQLFGDLKTDPLLLVTPTLFMLTIALLFLRLFPLALRLVTHLLGNVSGPSVLLGLWHMVRSPVHYSRLILLLILATSLGMFAAGFRATLDRGYRDRAGYEAGAPLRVEGIRQPTEIAPADLAKQVEQATGATKVVPVRRTNASYSPQQYRNVDAIVLGIDPTQFGKVAYWRDDFSGASLGSIERTLDKNAPTAPEGILVPEGSRWIGVWILTPSPQTNYTVNVRLVDANGRVVDYFLRNGRNTQPAPGGWIFFSAPLDQPGTNFGFSGRPGRPPAQPLHFLSLYVRTRETMQPETIQDYFDDLQVSPDSAYREGSEGFANGTVIDGFEDAGQFEPVNGTLSALAKETISRSDRQVHGGNASAQLTWIREPSGSGIHGFRLRGDDQPTVAYASDGFLKATGLHVGQTVPMYVDRVYMNVRIAGAFSYFPTFAAQGSQNLLVADLSRLQSAVARVPGSGDNPFPNEVWAGGTRLVADPESALKRSGVVADRVLSVAELRAGQQRDPLVAASWEGILFLSFSAILLLAALGFVVYSLLSARARTLEFAVLRTMGLSQGQIIAVVSFEQVFVTLAGVVAGTVLGFPLSRLMIGYMGVTENGAKVVPPYVSAVSWQAVITTYAGLALVFVTATGVLVLLAARVAVSRALRMGEA